MLFIFLISELHYVVILQLAFICFPFLLIIITSVTLACCNNYRVQVRVYYVKKLSMNFLIPYMCAPGKFIFVVHDIFVHKTR